MKTLGHLAIVVVIGITSTASVAQFVKGNDAVRVSPTGTKTVETPPVPKTGPASKAKPCAADGGCHAGAWHMVETSAGLMECTEPFARPTSCRKSTYGSQKLSRLWVAKKGPTWLWCQYPDLASKCVDMNARPPSNMPYDAVQ